MIMDNLIEDIKETLAIMINLKKCDEINKTKTNYQPLLELSANIYRREYEDLKILKNMNFQTRAKIIETKKEIYSIYDKRDSGEDVGNKIEKLQDKVEELENTAVAKIESAAKKFDEVYGDNEIDPEKIPF
jgi:hypothetical protein